MHRNKDEKGVLMFLLSRVEAPEDRHVKPLQVQTQFRRSVCASVSLFRALGVFFQPRPSATRRRPWTGQTTRTPRRLAKVRQVQTKDVWLNMLQEHPAFRTDQCRGSEKTRTLGDVQHQPGHQFVLESMKMRKRPHTQSRDHGCPDNRRRDDL